MKKILFLILLLIPAVFSAEDFTVSVSSEPKGISDYSYNSYECNLTEDELFNIKEFAVNNFNLTDNSFVNISYNSCYNYGDYYSIYVNMVAKKNDSDINTKTISFSLSYSNEIDYDVLMNKKADYFDYSLKNKYYTYYVNNTDEEYYVMLSYSYNENYTLDEFSSDLLSYYESVNGEKYFQSDYDYPIIVFKSKNSELLNIIPDFPVYISYYGQDLTFTFQGYSTGNYDLDQISLTSMCNIQKSNYYYPEFSDECYGNYIDKERLYFSANDYNENYSIYFSIYGIKGYKAELSASYWGDVTQEKVQEFINNALSKYFPEYSFSANFVDNQDSTIIRDFDFTESRFSDLNKSEDRENTNYYDSNVYVSVIEPHISLYSSSARIYSLDSKIMPPFYSQNTVITKDHIYSSIQLKENDAELAKTGLNEMLTGVVAANDWVLNMSLRQYYYYYRGVNSLDASGAQEIGSSSGMESLSPNSPVIAGVSETKTVSFDESKFDELQESDSIFDAIINFFKSFFV
ncbi:MAG: hypothetical protein WC376_01825 [Candidatus Nanoarchaeia archaeon]|jgi:hypothetical protein